MDSTGDTRLPWATEAECEAVAFQFDQFMLKGYQAFANGKRLKEFNPIADEIIMVKQIVAG
jgi:hypothetical protein